MLQSLLKYTIKPRGHEDAEKELDEVMDLRSKYPLYLTEGENSEFTDEYDRLRHEIQLYNAAKAAVKPRNVDVVLRDSRALKCKVKNTINGRRVAAVRAGVPASTSGGGDCRSVSQEVNITSPLACLAENPSQTTSSHGNEPPNTVTNNSLAIQPAGEPSTDDNASGQVEPESGPSLNPNPSLTEKINIKQAVSLLRSGTSYQVDSMIMEGATVNSPTMNINSAGSTGATIISHGTHVAQDVPQPARPRRAASRRIQQQPSNFLSGAYVSSGSIICSNSRVMGATLNVNSKNSSGAVLHRRAQARV